jgi:hypothetical protein
VLLNVAKIKDTEKHIIATVQSISQPKRFVIGTEQLENTIAKVVDNTKPVIN